MTKLHFVPEKPLRELEGHALARLRKSGVLPKLTREQFERATCRDIWFAFLDRGASFPGLDPYSALKEYRFVARRLGYQTAVPPLSMFALAVGLLNAKRVTITALRPLLGTVSHAALKEAAEALGFSISGAVVGKVAASPADLYALFPTVARGILVERVLNARRDGASMPSRADLGRVMALPERMRMVAACEIFRNIIAKQSKAGRYAMLKAHEHLVEAGIVGADHDLEILAAFAQGSDNLCPSEKRQRILKSHGLALRCAHDWIENLFQTEAASVAQLMPGYTGREDVFRLASRKVNLREEASPSERHPIVEQAFLIQPAVKCAVKNRMAQLRAIYASYKQALRNDRQAIASGIEVPVPVKGPAVLADGRLGVGRQTLNFRLVRADLAITEAASKCRNKPERSRLLRWVKNVWSETPSAELPILFIYDGAVAEGASNCAEPFFVDFYRWALFDPQASHSKKIFEHRAACLGSNGQALHVNIDRGLLVAEGSDSTFGRRALTSDPERGLIAIPLVGLFHAMLYAEIAFAATGDTGMRALELQQIRINDNANLVQTRDGEEVTVLRLRPKGFEPLADFILKGPTGMLLRPCAEFTAARWFGFVPGKPLRLPMRVLPSARPSRPLPPKQYLFQFKNACLKTNDVNLLMAALLWGLSEEKIHDRRYGKATADGAAGVPKRIGRRKLNFSRTSNTIENYDRSPQILSSVEAREFGNAETRDRQGTAPASLAS